MKSIKMKKTSTKNILAKIFKKTSNIKLAATRKTGQKN